tara:strand:- start:381 stop:941 length:561 start_codon:yes stop_codon:yes gene_type:complete
MKFTPNFYYIFLSLLSVFIIWSPLKSSNNKKESQKAVIERTDEEWKELLSPEQYRILREAGTERPNGKIYIEFKEHGPGTYYCVGCDTELFSSKEKFDSKCGWPSFYDPSNAKNVKTSVDYLLGYPRTEVLCAVCDGHLGHVFTGEGFDTPTDKRYCINGTVLKFVPLARVNQKKVSNSIRDEESK